MSKLHEGRVGLIFFYFAERIRLALIYMEEGRLKFPFIWLTCISHLYDVIYQRLTEGIQKSQVPGFMQTVHNN